MPALLRHQLPFRARTGEFLVVDPRPLIEADDLEAIVRKMLGRDRAGGPCTNDQDIGVFAAPVTTRNCHLSCSLSISRFSLVFRGRPGRPSQKAWFRQAPGENWRRSSCHGGGRTPRLSTFSLTILAPSM